MRDDAYEKEYNAKSNQSDAHFLIARFHLAPMNNVRVTINMHITQFVWLN